MSDPASQKSNTKFWLSSGVKLAATIVFVWFLCNIGIRADYWQGWAMLVFMAVFMVFVLILFRKKPGVLKERMDPGPGVKGWDRIFWFIYILLSLVFFIFAMLDGGHYQWSPQMPLAVYVAAYAVLIGSSALFVWAMYVNPFFSTRVRIQSERGHHVITEGPYRFVRHPGYLSAFFMFVSFALALGSVWSLVIVAPILVSVVIRTHLEDKTLHGELPGYADYAKKVKYRLFPGVW